MSVEAITWALKQPVKHSSAKFVLVALANCADAENARAWPSVAYLCEATSQDRKTVLANLKRLIDTGFIQDTGLRTGSTKSVVVYQLSSTENGTPKQSQERDSLDKEAVPFFPISSTVFPHKQSQNSLEAVPKTGHGTVRNRNRTVKEVNTALLPQLPAALVSDFLEIRKAKKLPLTKTAIDGIEREAEKAGLTLEQAVTACCEYGWGSFNAGWYAERNKGKSTSETAYQKSMRLRVAEVSPALAKPAPDEQTAVSFFKAIDVQAREIT